MVMQENERTATRENIYKLGKLLDFSQLVDLYNVEFTTKELIVFEKNELFPKRVMIGKNTARWIESEISDWKHGGWNQKDEEPAHAKENEKALFVYFISDGKAIKIGLSNNPESRLKSLQTAHHTKLEIVSVIEGGFEVERTLHEKFKSIRLTGEWFKDTPEIRQFITTNTKELTPCNSVTTKPSKASATPTRLTRER